MVKDFVKALFTIVALDAVWLGILARDFYFRNLEPIALTDQKGFAPRLGPALGVYLALAVALTVFVRPRVEGASRAHAFRLGALLGASVYAVYDLTNLATLKGWPEIVAVVDILWGATLCGLVAIVFVKTSSPESDP